MCREKIRVLITKAGLDGHDRGAKVVASLLRDSGLEVIYLGSFHTAEGIVNSAIEEDVDVVGLSSHCGEHLVYAPKILRLLKEKGRDDVTVLVGGVIPVEDVPLLEEMGVSGVFTTGSTVESIVAHIKERVERKARHS